MKLNSKGFAKRSVKPPSALNSLKYLLPTPNYSFFDLDIQRSKYIRPKVTVYKSAETIQGRELFKGGSYMRKYGM